MKNNNEENLIFQAKDAIAYMDLPSASRILAKIAQGEVKDPQVLDLKQKLQVVAFSDISDGEAADIFRNNLLDFFRIEIPLERSIQNRYMLQGSYNKNIQREILKKAILENQERLGGATIGQWLQKFDQEYKIEEREDRDVMNFMLNNSEARKLNESQKFVLKKILHAYDTLIADQLVDIYDLIDAKERLKRSGGVVRANKKQDEFRNFYESEERRIIGNMDMGSTGNEEARRVPDLKPVKMTVVQAMEKYPIIQDQIITKNLLRLKFKEEMVKGSIRNWIKDYYSVVGAGNRDMMKRSSYAYHSQNAKVLDDTDKQKLSAILKSLEENTPLLVDLNRKEIVFETKKVEPQKSFSAQNYEMERGKESIAPRASLVFGEKKNPENIPNQQTARITHVQGNRFNLGSDSFGGENQSKNHRVELGLKEKFFSKNDDSQNLNSGGSNISFSAPQQLPVEKEKVETKRGNGFLRRIKGVE